jgi:transketolase
MLSHVCAADLSELRAAVELAKQTTNKPSLIKVKTTIGFGSTKQGMLASCMGMCDVM